MFGQPRGIWCLSQNGSNWDVFAVSGMDGIVSSLFWAAPASLPGVYQTFSRGNDVLDTLTVHVAAGLELSVKPDVGHILEAFYSLDTAAAQAVLDRFLGLPAPFPSVALAAQLMK
jgi:hypothetical protein